MADAGRACRVPTAAKAFDDASDRGCFATSGEIVEGMNACKLGEYGMTCLAGPSIALPWPRPAGELQCKDLLFIRTSPGTEFYCCPCGP